MMGGAEIPQTHTSSRVQSTEEMDIAINDLNSKFANEEEGEETLDEYNRGPRRGDRLRTIVGRNVNPRGYDKFFDIMEVLEEEPVKVVAYKLRRGAGAWWQREQDNRRAQGRRPVDTWMRMKRMIKERLRLTPVWSVDQAQNMAMKAERIASKTRVGFRCSNMESLRNYGSRPNQIQSTIPSTTTTTSSSKASGSGVDNNKECQPVNSNTYARPTKSGNDGLISDDVFQEEDELEYDPLDGENTPYPHQQIRRIRYFGQHSEEARIPTPYPEAPIRRI
nr:hypothetical protein [Tanacetum cinerariifolium]